jgi:hypothetical protein
LTATPGPGSYPLKTKVGQAPKYSFGLKNSINYGKLLCSPGPANYNPKWDQQLKTSSAYSMRIRPNSADSRLKGPGPGAYEIRLKLEKPSYKFGNEKRDGLNNTMRLPGPGTYNIVNEFGTNTSKRPSTPIYSFGLEKRAKNTGNMTPGPGNYELKPRIGVEGKKITISTYRPASACVSKSNMTPGPGAYEFSLKHRPNTPSYRIGSAKRDADPIQRELMAVPASNTYSPRISDKQNQPQWKFGTGNRPPLALIEKVPGPGSYNTSKVIGDQAPKYTLRPKTAVTDALTKTPGPGSYESDKVEQIRPKSPTWRIGTSKKDDGYKELQRRGVPGPGMYESKTGFGGPQYRFGNEKRSFYKKNEVPGPGQYSLPCSIGDVQKYATVSGGFNEAYRKI